MREIADLITKKAAKVRARHRSLWKFSSQQAGWGGGKSDSRVPRLAGYCNVDNMKIYREMRVGEIAVRKVLEARMRAEATMIWTRSGAECRIGYEKRDEEECQVERVERSLC